MMLDRQSPHPRMTPSTRRQIASLALARAIRHALRTIEAPGLVAGAPDEHAHHRPSI
jgi:hypothetical protein